MYVHTRTHTHIQMNTNKNLSFFFRVKLWVCKNKLMTGYILYTHPILTTCMLISMHKQELLIKMDKKINTILAAVTKLQSVGGHSSVKVSYAVSCVTCVIIIIAIE